VQKGTKESKKAFINLGSPVVYLGVRAHDLTSGDESSVLATELMGPSLPHLVSLKDVSKGDKVETRGDKRRQQETTGDKERQGETKPS
jgi:hypothetical protein